MTGSAFLRGAVEVLLPSSCAACGVPLSWQEQGLCSACQGLLLPDYGERCSLCGCALGEGLEVCQACAESPPPQDETRVWGEYSGVLRKIIVQAKHGHRDDLIPLIAGQAAVAASRLSPPKEKPLLVTAVPSHWTARIRRGYVLAELLALHVARALDAPFKRILKRRSRARQMGKSRGQRLALTGSAFSVAHGLNLEGCEVILVDDVITTGATLRVCAAALKAAGAKWVGCAVLAATP